MASIATNLDRYKKDLGALIKLGEEMELDLALRSLKANGRLEEKDKKAQEEISGSFEVNYQSWYTESYAVIRQIIPHRLDEFAALYKGEGKRKEIDGSNYCIQDWLNGMRAGLAYNGKKYYGDFEITSMRFSTQLRILESAEARFDSSLFDIKQLVHADLLDSELDAARELLSNGYARSSGVIAGVVLEAHLAQVCVNHDVVVKKKNPTIADFNDGLKENGVLEVPDWRFIQRLGDLRNMCGHKKDREPGVEEVTELINGVEKITKILF